jgi:hypothetical protein
VTRAAPFGGFFHYSVLAGFDRQWPSLNLAVADFHLELIGN